MLLWCRVQVTDAWPFKHRWKESIALNVWEGTHAWKHLSPLDGVSIAKHLSLLDRVSTAEHLSYLLWELGWQVLLSVIYKATAVGYLLGILMLFNLHNIIIIKKPLNKYIGYIQKCYFQNVTIVNVYSTATIINNYISYVLLNKVQYMFVQNVKNTAPGNEQITWRRFSISQNTPILP